MKKKRLFVHVLDKTANSNIIHDTLEFQILLETVGQKCTHFRVSVILLECDCYFMFLAHIETQCSWTLAPISP